MKKINQHTSVNSLLRSTMRRKDSDVLIDRLSDLKTEQLNSVGVLIGQALSEYKTTKKLSKKTLKNLEEYSIIIL